MERGPERGGGDQTVREGLLVLLLVPLILAVLVVSLFGPLHGAMAALQAVLGLAGVIWLGAVAAARRLRASRGTLLWIVVGAVALRGVALAGDPELSDDRYRYAWEGGLVLAGKSPYAYAPDAPELAAERAAWPAVYANLNNPHVSAAYPPVTQAACALAVRLAGGVERAPFFLRVFFAVCDLLVLWPLFSLLRARGRSPALAVAWAWSPLVALEFAGAGHFDALGVLLLVGGLACLAGRDRRGETGAAVFLAAGVLVKLLPAVVLPFAARGARRPWIFAAVPFGVVGLGFAPLAFFEGGFGGLGRGLGEYGFRWESTSLVYRWVEPVFAGFFDYDEGASDPRRLARGCVALAWGGVALWAWWRRLDAADAALVLIAALLVLSPTLHPWYLTWIVPLLALRTSPSLALLVALAPLLYWPLTGWKRDAVWVEPAWLWPAVALPFFLVLAAELLFRRLGSRP